MNNQQRKLTISCFFILFLIPLVSGIYLDCDLNSPCNIGEYVYNDTYSPLTTQVCTINITNPSNVQVVTTGTMTNNSLGYHNYTYTPLLTGGYTAVMFCNNSGDVGYLDRSFYVSNVVSNIDTQLNTSHGISGWNATGMTAEEVWEYNNSLALLENINSTIEESVDLDVHTAGVWYASNTMTVYATVRNTKGEMVNASTIQGRITLVSDGTIVKDANMTYVQNGLYSLAWTIPASPTTGMYLIRVNATYGTTLTTKTTNTKIATGGPYDISVETPDEARGVVTAYVRITNQGEIGLDTNVTYWISGTAMSTKETIYIGPLETKTLVRSFDISTLTENQIYYFYSNATYGTDQPTVESYDWFRVAKSSTGGGGGGAGGFANFNIWLKCPSSIGINKDFICELNIENNENSLIGKMDYGITDMNEKYINEQKSLNIMINQTEKKVINVILKSPDHLGSYYVKTVVTLSGMSPIVLTYSFNVMEKPLTFSEQPQQINVNVDLGIKSFFNKPIVCLTPLCKFEGLINLVFMDEPLVILGNTINTINLWFIIFFIIFILLLAIIVILIP